MGLFEQVLLFIGRFHPVVIHLPICAVVLLALVEFLPWKGFRDAFDSAKTHLLIFAIVTAAISITTGLLLEQEGSYGAERLFWHKLLVILMTAPLLIALFTRFRKKTSTKNTRKFYQFSIGIAVGLLIAGTHHGSVMTHGRNYLTEYFPFNSNSSESEVISGIEGGDLKHIATINLVKNNCIECHNPDKKKGKLDLESILTAGIEEHPIIWDKVAHELKSRQMPPDDEPDLPRPTETEYDEAVAWLNHRIAATAEKEKQTLEPALAVLDNYCTSCHSDEDAQSGLDIASLIREPAHLHSDIWEDIIRKMNARQMPPAHKRWPDDDSYKSVIHYLENAMDANAASKPNPGRTSTFRRLTRTEYQNAIRDLLALNIKASDMLPRDEVSHGFDNITVTELSPTLMNSYISAAEKISRLAVGTPLPSPKVDIIRVKPDLTQSKRLKGMSLGTRGGVIIPYHFPRSGTYDIAIKLARDRNEAVEGLSGEKSVLLMLNKEVLKTFTVKRPKGKSGSHDQVDQHLKLRVNVKAGQQDLAVTFINSGSSLLDRRREPHEASYNHHRHPRQEPAVYQVSITGPFEDKGVAKTASRKKIFGSPPPTQAGSAKHAEQIIRRLARQAYRRSLTDNDVKPLMAFYHNVIKEGKKFDDAIEMAISGILVNPHFLFRVEKEPKKIESGDVYQVNDFELASRLSFFLWSSLPDAELIQLAEDGELHKPEVLEAQTLRMLKDPRARSLTENFASQWLYLRNIDSVTPDQRLYPDFDENLRQAMRRETELLFEDVVSNDKSVLDLITSDYTYLNERIAKHYEIPGVHGERFRKVAVPTGSARGGILRHGSILSVTSYANRTSPVIRGAWILENIVGAPPPPPPPNVSTFDDDVIPEDLPIRARLVAHRENPECSSCHQLMDPIGFSLEHYDAIGQYRHLENGAAVDSSGRMPDGTVLNGVEALEKYIVANPKNFVGTMVEKLLIYGLGRGIEPYDMPTIRRIIKSSQEKDYKFSSLIIGIVKSYPFQHRIKQ